MSFHNVLGSSRISRRRYVDDVHGNVQPNWYLLQEMIGPHGKLQRNRITKEAASAMFMMIIMMVMSD